MAAILAAVMASGLIGILATGLFTPLTMPAWTSTAVGLLVLVLLQVLAFASLFAFLVLHARSQPTFIPLRDYEYFVDRCTPLVTPAREDRRPGMRHAG